MEEVPPKLGKAGAAVIVGADIEVEAGVKPKAYC
jgi:hypothetical protein